MKLTGWMRGTMLATALMNLVGALAFLPSAQALRTLGGFPNEAHPLYFTTVGLFIFIFGLAYLWVAVTGRAAPLFISVAAAGKLGFFALLALYAGLGLLPAKAVLSGLGDLLFGLIFLFWLLRRRA
jgi:hypothetical protein